jgi:WD40 repeat protein
LAALPGMGDLPVSVEKLQTLGSLPQNPETKPHRLADRHLAMLTSPHDAIARFRQYALSENGQCVVTLDADRQVEVHQFDVQDESSLALGEFKDGSPTAVANDGSWCIMSDSSGLLLLQSDNPAERIRLKMPKGRFRGTPIDGRPVTDGNRWMAARGFNPDIGTGLMGHPRDVFLWDLADPEREPVTVHRHTEKIKYPWFADGRVISAGPREILVTKLTELDTHHSLRSDGGSISALRRSPDSRHLIAGYEDHAIRVWDLRQIEEDPRVLYGHGAPPKFVSMSQQGGWLVSTDGTEAESRLWPLLTGMRGIEPIVVSGNESWDVMAFSPDSQSVFFGGSTQPDRNAPILSVRAESSSRSDPKEIHDKYYDLLSLQVSPDGKWILAVSHYLSPALLFLTADLAADPIEIPLLGPPYTSVRFSNDGKWLILASHHNHSAGLFRMDSAQRSAKPAEIEGIQQVERTQPGRVRISLAPRTVIIEPGNKWLLTESAESKVRLWRISVGEIEISEDLTPDYLAKSRIALSSPDGRWVFAEQDQSLRLVDLANPLDAPIELPRTLAETWQFKVSRDARWMLTETLEDGHSSGLWKLAAGTAEPVKLNDQQRSPDFDFTADSRSLVGWGRDGKVLIWQLTDDRELTPLELGNGNSRIRFGIETADGQCLITADDSGVVRLHDRRDLNRNPVTLGTHQGRILAMQISPDQERLATLGTDRKLKLWRLWKPGAEGTDRLRPLIELARTVAEVSDPSAVDRPEETSGQ